MRLRLFNHLRPQHPVTRFNWSIQEYDALDQRPEHQPEISAETPLYYRTERQSLVRLPDTGAIAFTIRVYVHPLSTLEGETMAALFRAVDGMPPDLAHYKGFDRLARALQKYRACDS